MNPHAGTTPRTMKRNLMACAASALLAASAFVLAPQAQASTFISVRIAPPLLPVYEQPEMPGPGYMWTPGYWAYDDEVNDYYWVPGTWVLVPYEGALWTPGYWGWNEGVYIFHPGYWGNHVGYYGGINYGYGYIGIGYVGGYWHHGGFYYNSAYNRYGSGIHIHAYDRRVAGDIAVNRFSFNGPGGADHRATRDELRYEHEHHTPASAEQREHADRARHDVSLRASVNHGSPALAASTHAGGFDHGHEVERHDADAGLHGQDHHDHRGSPHEPTAGPSHTVDHASSHHHHSHASDNGQPTTYNQDGVPMNQDTHHGGPMPVQPTHVDASHQPAPPKHSESHFSDDHKHHDDHKH